MPAIQQEKLDQAVALLSEYDLDCWLLLVRETGENADPSLSLIFDGSLTWQSALRIDRSGERIAIVGRYDVHKVPHRRRPSKPSRPWRHRCAPAQWGRRWMVLPADT